MLLATGTKLKFRRPAGAIKVPRNVPRYVKQYRIFSVEFSYKEYLVIHLYSLFDLPFKKKIRHSVRFLRSKPYHFGPPKVKHDRKPSTPDRTLPSSLKAQR